ncbi:fimbrial biogenesis outer membrane usher protein [Leclercia adecarboxylata]|uniref:fimbria/pilus outer membrane usher protein n=1 Tax=Leclercia adecarboxylata TaxID=83655 RepID=UPI00202A7EE7|nr:fimbria/pilus outer membrane usher protein [Leclercia adecarboxylata]URO01357.1 fimbrial biogenesis outer membrane usher protein [Leclercia adecarboxylata]
MEKNKPTYVLTLGLGLSIVFSSLSASAQEHFNPHLLETEGTEAPKMDLSLFAKDQVPPGDYNVDIYLNGSLVDSKTLSFRPLKSASSSESVGACLSVTQLKAWNVRVDNYFSELDKTSECVDLYTIPGADEKIDLARQRFDLNLPQIALFNTARGYVSPERWDEGINAGLLNYSVSGQQDLHHRNGTDSSSQFVSLQPGVNIGAWRFRNYSTWTHSESENNWDSVYTYASRNIKSLKSQLLLGQSTTRGGIFDSVGFTGIQMYSDNDMKPDSLQGFAPTIRGIARSNAEVTVYQNGHSIYKATVPPGPFEFSDMYPTGSSGDLQVVIKESDGSQSSFIVPYATLPVLQREGQVEYGLVAGKTRQDGSGSRAEDFNFIQGSAAWGVGKGVTIYGGYIQAENKYANLIAGTGFNLGSAGALSLDVSRSWADIPQPDNMRQQEHHNGQSYRVRYSKTLQQTNTDIAVAGYKFSTRGYLSFQDFLNDWDPGNSAVDNGRERNRFDVTVSQTLPVGTLSLTMYDASYWNSEHADSVNLGFSSTLGPVSYSFNYAHTKNVNGSYSNDSDYEDDNVFSLNLSVPFSAFSHSEAARSISANYSMNSSKNGDTTHNVGVSGTALQDNQLNWQVSEGYNADSEATNGNVTVGYQSTYADMSAGYSYDDYSRRLNYSLRGGMVMHSDGITLARQLNDSVALVETPGVSDMPVSGQTNVHTDRFGNAIVPYVRPYHSTLISLNTVDAGETSAAIDNVAKTVVPTKGAVVRVKYNTWIGSKAMMTLIYKDKPVPFGAIVTQTSEDSDDTRSSIVGDGGEAYLVGLAERGRLTVKWGEGRDKHCYVDYSLAGAKTQADIQFINGVCHPETGER